MASRDPRMTPPTTTERYVYSPTRGSVRVDGFPAAILNYRMEESSAYRTTGEHVIVPGHYERDLVDWARDLASGSQQFVDCGAHTGSWTLVMAAHFREVHAFEPQRLIFQQLCGNVALNGLTNVFAHHTALDTQPGTVTLHRSGVDRGSSTARLDVVERFGFATTSEVVPIATLDSFADVLTDVGLIKIDVEGLELRVLRAATLVLLQNRLPKLLIECWSAEWYQDDKRALLDFLDRLGYCVVPIRGYADMLLAEAAR